MYQSRYIILLILFLRQTDISGQSAFDCACQRIYYDPISQVFRESKINTSNSALQFPVLHPAIFTTPIAIGFHSTKGVIYVLESGTNLLHLFYADGTLSLIPDPINLPTDLDFKAGEITPDGTEFYVVGSRSNIDRWLYKINLVSGAFEVTEIVFSDFFHIQDMAFDPFDNFLYLYDERERHVLKIDLTNFGVTGLFPLEEFREIETIYFDTFGDLYGLGTTQFGVAGGLFRIDKSNGDESSWATGPVAFIEDGTACPYTVKMQNEPSSLNAFPCEDLVFTYTIANATRVAQNNLTFQTNLPQGFKYKNVLHSAIGGSPQYIPDNRELKISSINIPPGIHEVKLIVELDEFIEAGMYSNSARIIGLPQTLGGDVISDFRRTPREGDKTPIEVSRIEDDSLFYTRFICTGDSIMLDGSGYGTTFSWSNGSNESMITVSEAGRYSLRARTGCADIFVEFDVTVASCPFRLDMDHLPIPDSTFPCTEIIYEFVIDNATGVIQERIQFTDTLPIGINYLDIISNPFGGQLDESLIPGVIKITDMTLPVGMDTLHVLVEVSEIDPGTYMNQARLDNLPLELGTFRVSDDPRTISLDSTDTVVLGVEADSLNVELILCKGEKFDLDASIYGSRFLWFNGSTESMVNINAPGIYEVSVFNGCNESKVFFNVIPGDPIEIKFEEDVVLLNLGDSIRLEPKIFNTLDSLALDWSGKDTAFLSCLNCEQPIAFPVQTARMQLKAGNGVCSDSSTIKILIDNSRRFFLPNVFTPNGDNINDYFGISSPDFGEIKSFRVFDRSGNVVFNSSQTIINTPETGWDGTLDNKEAPAGVYLFNFEITFLDGLTRNYTGDVTLLR